jgi:hypothetical protein
MSRRNEEEIWNTQTWKKSDTILPKEFLHNFRFHTRCLHTEFQIYQNERYVNVERRGKDSVWTYIVMFGYCRWRNERIEVYFVENRVNVKDRDDILYNKDLNELIGRVKKDKKNLKNMTKNVEEKEEINHHKTFYSFFRNDTPTVEVKIRKKDE